MRRLASLMSAALMLGLWVSVSADVIHVPGDYATIQEGINAAVDLDTVLVHDGTYAGDGNRDLDFGGTDIVVMSEHGPEFTVIDCGGSELYPHRGFYFHSGESVDSKVQGFTIKNGYRTGAYPDNCGGGIYCENSSPTIVGNVITSNHVDHYGGGIFCTDFSYAIIDDNVIRLNTADYEGGGIFCWENSDVYIEGNRITSNQVNWYGGGVAIWGCDPVLTNNLIAGNTAQYGGGIEIYGSASAEIAFSTINANTAQDQGGAIWCANISSGSVNSCILWGDTAATGPEIYVGIGCVIGVDYSDVEGGWSGTYNIDEDPIFWTGPLGEYYLSQTAAGQPEQSPCVDRADLGVYPPDGTTRTDEDPDVYPPDMGYHYPISGLVEVAEEDLEEIGMPSWHLGQNYPNPFGSATTIAYSLAVPTRATVAVYDIRGALVRQLVSGMVSAGRHQVVWDGRDGRGHKVASGVYFCRLEAGEHGETKRMVVLR